jgi:hypothetical protein
MENKKITTYTKRKEDFCFKFHGVYDISKIKDAVINFDEEWGLDKSRQEMGNKSFAHTSTYFLKDVPLIWSVGDIYPEKINQKGAEIWDLIEPIIKDLESIHDGRRGRVLFTNLVKGEKIELHSDIGQYLGVARRNHIPIITNKDVLFHVGEEIINMKEGECWEINNNKLHKVHNHSELDRVHLTIDIIPNKYLV